MTPGPELLPGVLFIMTFYCSSKLSTVVLLLLGSPWGTAGLTPPNSLLCPHLKLWIHHGSDRVLCWMAGTDPQLVPCHGVISVPRESCVSPFKSLLCFSLSLFFFLSYLQKQCVPGTLESSESHEEAAVLPVRIPDSTWCLSATFGFTWIWLLCAYQPSHNYGAGLGPSSHLANTWWSYHTHTCSDHTVFTAMWFSVQWRHNNFFIIFTSP